MPTYDENTILNSLVDDIVTVLTEGLKIDVADSTKAKLVRFGNLQDDPTVNQINILVHRGNKDWRDELKLNDEGIFSPTYEIGGTQYWWRRFIIELTLFFDNELVRETARNKAQIVLARAQNLLYNMPIDTTVDDFGEQVHSIQIRNAYMDEAGGEGEFIWAGEIRVEFMTTIRGF